MTRAKNNLASAAVAILTLGILVACGENNKEKNPNTLPTPEVQQQQEEKKDPPPPSIDPALQQQLFDEAMAITGRLGDCLGAITDPASIEAAEKKIAALDAELASLAEKLAATEAPGAELLQTFRAQAREADLEMMNNTKSSAALIQAIPVAIRQLNRALDSL